MKAIGIILGVLVLGMVGYIIYSLVGDSSPDAFEQNMTYAYGPDWKSRPQTPITAQTAQSRTGASHF